MAADKGLHQTKSNELDWIQPTERAPPMDKGEVGSQEVPIRGE